MQGTTPGRRAVLVTLSLALVGDRVVISGAEPDVATARLAGALQAAGVVADIHAGVGPRTVRGLARGVAARDPEAILVRIADDALLDLAGAWVGALRAECPKARIVLLSDDIDPVALGVDAQAAVEDFAAVLAAAGYPVEAQGPDVGAQSGAQSPGVTDAVGAHTGTERRWGPGAQAGTGPVEQGHPGGYR